MIECKSFLISAPEFKEKFYEFNIDRNDLSYTKKDPIGQIKVFAQNTNILNYEIINLETENKKDLPFVIDNQVFIFII